MNERIEQLEARVKELERVLDRLMDSYTNFGESTTKLIQGFVVSDRERCEDTTDIYKRLKRVELHLWPGIQSDVQAIHRITKAENQPRFNPLDVKKPKKD